MLETQVVEKRKKHIFCSKTIFKQLCYLWDNVENKGRAERPYMTILYSACAVHVDN